MIFTLKENLSTAVLIGTSVGGTGTGDNFGFSMGNGMRSSGDIGRLFFLSSFCFLFSSLPYIRRLSSKSSQVGLSSLSFFTGYLELTPDGPSCIFPLFLGGESSNISIGAFESEKKLCYKISVSAMQLSA